MKKLLIVIGILFALIIGMIGCTAMMAGVAVDVAEDIEADIETGAATTEGDAPTMDQGLGSKDASADLVSVELGPVDIVGWHTPTVTVKNNSDGRSDYSVDITLTSADGSVQFDTSWVYIQNVEAGQSATGEGLFTAEDLPAGVVINVVEFQRTASV